MRELDQKIVQAIYTLSDEIDYNIYDSKDIAEYIHADEAEVKQSVEQLYNEGYLGECMSYEDDGVDTYILANKAFETFTIKEY